jgi:hypothetical protein|eukprot:COSAG01_NODE_14669_length_1423_cov_2.117069_2_plen_76_part_00
MCVPTCTYVALVLHLIVRCMEPHPAALGFLGTAVVEVAAFARLALVARRHRLHVTLRGQEGLQWGKRISSLIELT